MTPGTILFIILFLFAIGAFPIWPHSREWGYRPFSGIGFVMLLLLTMLLLGFI